MGDVKKVEFKESQVGPRRTAEILRQPSRYHLKPMSLTSGKDDWGRSQTRFEGVWEGRVRQAFHAMTDYGIAAEGIKPHPYLSMAAAPCDAADQECKGGRLQAAILDKEKAGTGYSTQAPTDRVHPTAAYVGDLNGDGRPDLLVVFSQGPSLVFTQQR